MKIYPLLKFFYNGLLTGMPLLTYNPFTKNNFMCEFNVKPYSTYLNYRLDDYQAFKLSKLISDKNDSPEEFKLKKVSILKDEKPSYYLSVNIYNCSLPIIPEHKSITRLEVNTYVEYNNTIGTLIVDYCSDQLSMDPVNIFKKKSNVWYLNVKDTVSNLLNGFCVNDNITLFLDMKNKLVDPNLIESKSIELSDDLIKYSDKIYYTSGVFDKLYFDSTLIYPNIKIPTLVSHYFNFYNLTFEKPDNFFFFEDKISFSGSIWNNVFKF